MANIMRIGGGGGGEKPELTVTAPTGSTVVCTKGAKTVTTQEVSGTWPFNLPEFGVWTVTATKDGIEYSHTVNIQNAYELSLPYKPVVSLTPANGVTYTSGISTLTAEQMNRYGAEISNNANITNTTGYVYIDDGTLHYAVSVGDSINLTVNGSTYEFVVIGFNHDELDTATAYGTATATGKAGFTLQMRNCLATTYCMNPSSTNVNGWEGCAFRTTLQETIKSTMDSAWRSAVKTVKKLASAGNQSASIITSDDTLFLLSEIEIFGSVTYSKSGEGSQYAWYRAGNTKVKSVGGFADYWWGRSPRGDNGAGFCSVVIGGSAYGNNAGGSHGVAFALCV